MCSSFFNTFFWIGLDKVWIGLHTHNFTSSLKTVRYPSTFIFNRKIEHNIIMLNNFRTIGFMTLCTHLLFQFEHFLFVYIEKKLSWILKIFKNRILLKEKFGKYDHPKTFPRVTWIPTKNLGPIGLAVLTNRQTDKQII